MFGNRVEHQLVETEAQARGQHSRAEHADGILDEAHARIADRPDDLALEIARAH